MKLTLSFAGDTMVEIYAAMRLELARVDGNHAPGPYSAGAGQQVASSKVSVPPGSPAPSCPSGHGVMRFRKGGTIQSGERIGQTYPPFWSCAECRETVEIGES